ncbi:MAG TPA: methyltransferase domain-containing protein [Terracidiphilus sp.]|nr:methyltransferase domain-containing protein [Terracidiphilus sp.]
MNEKRFHASQAHRLEAPERREWMPPDEIVRALGLRPGDVIADIGAGTGYFALPMALAAGPEGRVYAVDAQAEMLSLLGKKPQSAPSANIELVHAEAEATGLPSACCNCVFLANVWHEFDDRAAVLREVRRLLKPGGRIAILDWRPDVEREAGPPLEHRLRAEDAVTELLAAGFLQVTHTTAGRFSWLVQGLVQALVPGEEPQ